MENTEEELESFRKQWRQEVSGRSNPPSNSTNSEARPTPSHRPRVAAAAPKPPSFVKASSTIKHSDHYEDYEPRTFHDLEDKEKTLRLGSQAPRAENIAIAEPRSALEYYEKAVEREKQGKLGDSVSLYRKAFKLDDNIHEKYKNKYFPSKPGHLKPILEPTPTSVAKPQAQIAEASPPQSVDELIEHFAVCHIERAPPETDLSPLPPCPIAALPEELLAEILQFLAIDDVASYARLAQVCKRFAFLVTTEERIWKRLILGHEFGVAAMRYRYSCNLRGEPIRTIDEESSDAARIIPDLTPSLFSTYRAQFRSRPRLRFNGAYISTVNYQRPGASHQTMHNWQSPVLIVTYYRYLRFFRDGSVISLLTVAEPLDVVHHLTLENLHTRHTAHSPAVAMKDALRGRWRLSGPARVEPKEKTMPSTASVSDVATSTDTAFFTSTDSTPVGEYVKEPVSFFGQDHEEEGNVHIETFGVTEKYLYKMHLGLSSAGRTSRNNKLSWKNFWSYNKLTDDWGEFGLKNDKPFYFSRVKSYGMGW
ncbi:hypothetical protein MRB53_040465 [Persea americana]|nr:hypothetical protein MRB53_040465 [Persea americana]